jgi:hypothetical protein
LPFVEIDEPAAEWSPEGQFKKERKLGRPLPWADPIGAVQATLRIIDVLLHAL